MKKWFLLLLIAGFTKASAQGVQAELSAMDSAFAQGHYQQAAQLAEKIYPLAQSQIKNDNIIMFVIEIKKNL